MSMKLKEKDNVVGFFDSTNVMSYSASLYMYTLLYAILNDWGWEIKKLILANCQELKYVCFQKKKTNQTNISGTQCTTKSSATKNKSRFYLTVSSWSSEYIWFECQIISLEIKNLHQREAVEHAFNSCRQSQYNFCLPGDKKEQLLATHLQTNFY